MTCNHVGHVIRQQAFKQHAYLADLRLLRFFLAWRNPSLLFAPLTARSILSLRTFRAIFRFWLSSLCSWHSTNIPVGICLSCTLFRVLLMDCPPGPWPLTNFSSRSSSFITTGVLLFAALRAAFDISLVVKLTILLVDRWWYVVTTLNLLSSAEIMIAVVNHIQHQHFGGSIMHMMLKVVRRMIEQEFGLFEKRLKHTVKPVERKQGGRSKKNSHHTKQATTAAALSFCAKRASSRELLVRTTYLLLLTTVHSSTDCTGTITYRLLCSGMAVPVRTLLRWTSYVFVLVQYKLLCTAVTRERKNNCCFSR